MAKGGFAYEELCQDPGQHEIRLLTLLPGDPGSPIRCEIVKTRLTECPPYNALSYVWGNPAVSQDILLQDYDFTVTRNLFDALQRLRNLTSTLTLWIDAICINQSSVPEKNHHILLMRQIYENADCVSVFLGEASSAFDANGLSLVPQLLQAIQVAEQRHMKLLPPSIDDLELGRGYLGDRNLKSLVGNIDAVGLPSPFPFPYAYEAFGEILSRPWFERVWILQEIAVSQSARVICGDISVSWNDFSQAILACKAFGLIPVFINPRVALWAQLIAGLQKSVRRRRLLTLLQLLIAFRHCKATDPRDKVYALCGLVAEGTPNIVPDYARDTLEVYKYVASEILKEPNGLDIFHMPRSGKSLASYTLPSWCPDWSSDYVFCEALFNPRDDGAARTKYKFRASRGGHSYIRIDKELETLIMKGMYFDEVATVTAALVPDLQASPEELYPDNDLNTAFTAAELWLRTQKQIHHKVRVNAEEQKILAGWERMASNTSHHTYPTGESHDDVYRRTLTADYAPNGEEAQKKEFRDWLRHQKVFRQVTRFPVTFQVRATRVVQAGYRLTAKRMSSSFALNMLPAAGRRLARTKKGYLALVPDLARRGDEIWLVQGSNVPLVLRQPVILSPGPDDRHHVLIGVSYVHGIMYGDAFDEGRCVEVKVR